MTFYRFFVPLFALLSSQASADSDASLTSAYQHRADVLAAAPGDLVAYWTHDQNSSELAIAVRARTQGWLALGIATAGMLGSDIMLGWVDDESGEPYVTDRFARDFVEPGLDVDNGGSDDWQLVTGQQNGSFTTLHVRRALRTSDELNDNEILSGFRPVTFAMAPSDPAPAVTKHTVRDRVFLDLLGDGGKRSELPVLPDEDVRVLNLTFPPYAVPTDDTTYACFPYELPATPSHVVRLRALPDAPLIHHFVLYRCATPPEWPEGDGAQLCDAVSTDCGQVLYEWSLGGPPLDFPLDSGLLLGDGGLRHVLLSMHYDNPDGRDDIVDSSTLQLFHTPVLRPYDALHLLLGINVGGSASIPPGEKAYVLESTCTLSNVPPGAKFAVSVPHMHDIGSAFSTELLRDGAPVAKVANVPVYDGDFQDTYTMQPPVELRDGDQIVTRCTYDSSARSDDTMLWLGRSDEMCFNFAMLSGAPRGSSHMTCFEEEPGLFGLPPVTGAIVLGVLLCVLGTGIYVAFTMWQRRSGKHVADVVETDVEMKEGDGTRQNLRSSKPRTMRSSLGSSHVAQLETKPASMVKRRSSKKVEPKARAASP
mmetsp:Transcript_5081/g.16389  ORF Transcript_5081/g.16389 Transcript_5081/m.16389 type:complete len:593 (-) Transcript_5081:27-1805(-)